MESLSVKKGSESLLSAAGFALVTVLLALRMIFCGVLYSMWDRIFVGAVLIFLAVVLSRGFGVSYELTENRIAEKNVFGRCIRATDAQDIRNITYYTKDITTFRRTRTEKYIRILLSDDTEYIIPYEYSLWECMNVMYGDKIKI